MTAAPPGRAVHYLLDKSASRFVVRAFASGFLSAMGHNPTIAIRDFTGEASFDSACPEQTHLQMRIRADSLEVTEDIKAADRREMENTMKRDVLLTAQYPCISFESSGVAVEPVGEGRYKVAMQGALTLRGVTRNMPVAAQVVVNGNILRASGEFTILQSDFGIPLVSVAGGALKLKDELKLTFDIVSRHQE